MAETTDEVHGPPRPGWVGPGWGGVAHVFLGAALALPPLLLGWLFATALGAPGRTWLGAGSLVALAGGASVVVAAVALGPAVRPVEVAAARLLLHLDLPDPLAPGARESRVLGALWVGVCATVGGTVLLALLVLAPLAVGLAAYPFGSADRLDGPGFRLHVDPGWGAAWLVIPASLCAAGAVLALPAGGRLLRAWAPTFLSPLGADRVAESLRRERAATEQNLLARELHDSLGHALSAITVQAAAARQLSRDTSKVDTYLEAIETVGRDALEELDEVLGLLRSPSTPGRRHDLHRLVEPHRTSAGLHADIDRLDDLPAVTRLALDRVVREGLANADRHGTEPRSLVVRRRAGQVEVDLTNALPDAARGPGPGRPAERRGGGSGLTGLRDRVARLGGSVAAGPDGSGTWRLSVRLPADGERPPGVEG